MLNETYCTLCLSHNKRTINIFKTDVQCVYENLANITVTYQTCWMCFICHERLRQCYLLKKLAVKTRGLIENVCENEIDIKFGTFESLLNLSTSNTKIISSLLPADCDIKTEPDEKTEINWNYTEIKIEAVETTNSFINYEQPSSSSYSDSKDLQVVDPDHRQDPLKLERSNTRHEAKELKLIIDKLSPSIIEKYVRTKHIEQLEGEGEATYTTEQIKQEIKEEVADEGIGRGYEMDISDNCKQVMHHQKFSQKEHLRDHSSVHTGDKLYGCDLCLKKFSRKGNLRRHIRVHIGTGPGYEMDISDNCEELDQTSDAPSEQYKEQFSCAVCLKKFSRKEHLRRHISVHKEEKRYSCDVCLKKFSQKGVLQRHIRVHTGDKPYSCDVCLKKFSRKGDLGRHSSIHTGDKPYSCDLCLKKFSEKRRFQDHISVHTGDKPYSCDVCLKKFSRKEVLQRHISVHKEDKPYSCDVCLKKFSLKAYLLEHSRVHTEDKPYSCDVCLKKFSRKRYLERHSSIHTGEKPYSCDVCLKKFLQKVQLRQHSTVHTGDKPYSCDVCLKKFSHKGQLREHSRIHTGDKPYSCDVCLKKFSRKRCLKRHIKVYRDTEPNTMS